MNAMDLTAPTKSHLLSVVEGLVQCGWVIEAAPAKGRLARNGQLITLEAPKQTVRIRLFVYKVTESSRGKPDERRVEITSTYQKGLKQKRGYQDIVLGIDLTNNVFVGVDPRRMRHGGKTGNASSFFDREGLAWNREDEMLILPRRAKLLGNENHAFLMPSCLTQYFFNVMQIHFGVPFDTVPVAPRIAQEIGPKLQVPSSRASGHVLILRGPDLAAKPRKIAPALVTAFEQAGYVATKGKTKLSPGDLLAIKRKCEENGYIGEEFALGKERMRLKKKGRADLASRVRWVSLESVSEGYDILSFEGDETQRFIEVKSTQGNSRTFEMSENEWQRAEELGDRYCIYRVTRVRTYPRIRVIRNPSAGLKNGTLQRTTVGWMVRILK